MSTITFSCPECGGLIRTEFDDQSVVASCSSCQEGRQLLNPELEGGYLRHCLACPSTELFVRKDFPQRLGVTIVVIGFAISTIFWGYHMVIASYAVLFVTALIDIVLYLTMGDVLECYRCHAQYRDLPGFEDYAQFDLEAYERHRQQAIRLEEAKQQQAATASLPTTSTEHSS